MVRVSVRSWVMHFAYKCPHKDSIRMSVSLDMLCTEDQNFTCKVRTFLRNGGKLRVKIRV